jgi:hypothetical protein
MDVDLTDSGRWRHGGVIRGERPGTTSSFFKEFAGESAVERAQFLCIVTHKQRTVPMRSATRTVASTFVAFPALVVGLVLGSAERVQAGPLNPFDFASLGAFPTGASPYTFNTGGTPTMTDDLGNVVATGVVYNGIAVFDFNSINIPLFPGADTATGPLPLALLSRSDAVIAGGLIGSASFNANGPGGGAGGIYGVLGSSPVGGGPGGGQPGVLSGLPAPGGGGGGYGGAGGAGANGELPGGAGGSTYGGNLATLLQGGSGGAAAPITSGGGGGGAIELVAAGSITVSGFIAAAGGNALPGYGGGGGGSGGGILLDANSVLLTGSLLANGGAGNPFSSVPGSDGEFLEAGGGGGGGVISILTATGGFENQGGTIDVSGGAGGSGLPNGPGTLGGSDGTAGGDGIVTIVSVPEPTSLVPLSTGLLLLLGVRWMRRSDRRHP